MLALPSILAFLEGLGGSEMAVIFLVILLLFGGKKLPEFARGMGKSIREFKKAAAGVEEEFKRALDEDERLSKARAEHPPLTAAQLPPPPVAVPEPSSHDEHYGATSYHDEAGPVATTEPAPAAALPSETHPAATPPPPVTSTPASVTPDATTPSSPINPPVDPVPKPPEKSDKPV